MDYSSLLNAEQLAPVKDTDGGVLVLAGAGSGKTRVLTYRIAYLIDVRKVDSHNILAITFTNKAAKEMKERVDGIIGNNNTLISTFHSLCARILRWEINNLEGYSNNFSIYDEGDCNRILTRIIKDMGIDDTSEIKKDIRWHISNAKNHNLSPLEYSARIKGEENYLFISNSYEQYENTLKTNNALDFDDLVLKTVQLFAKNKEVLSKYQERFKYIMVDEFQDTNKLQYVLIRYLGAKHGNVFVVGDDDQSIYGWRWAEIANIQNFVKHFPGARTYKLQQNYRSTSNILDLANKIVGNNTQRMDKQLWTSGEKGVNVVYQSNWSEKAEADYVVDQINSLMRYNNYDYKDFAILVRANSISKAFEDRFALYSYPYKVIGGNKFYERKEIKDFLAYLKLIVNTSDNESILRVINFPKRGIGDSAIKTLVDSCAINGYSLYDGIMNLDSLNLPKSVHNKVMQFANVVQTLVMEKDSPLQDFIEYADKVIDFGSAYDIDNTEDRNRLENIAEFVGSVKEFCKDNKGAVLADFLQSVSLMTDTLQEDVDNSITLATVHGVKGLEYRCVFIVGLEEGIFPSIRKGSSDSEVEEERRIMYVAVTRARERLYLTSAESRFRFGKVDNCKVSRFVVESGLIKKKEPVGDDVDFAPRATKHNFNQIIKSTPAFATKASVGNAKNIDIGKYKVGMRVSHTRFGEGEIIEITGENAHIKFQGLGVKVFNLRLAPISIV